MKIELDHFFILTDSISKTGDLLVSLGLKESFSRDHKGQGTSNRRFDLSNSMLELLWLRDAEESNNGPAKDLKFQERTSDDTASPFGFVFTKLEASKTQMPFDGWKYQPEYFKPQYFNPEYFEPQHFEPLKSFHVANNSENTQEPLCIYAPFIDPIKRTIEKGTFKSITSIKVFMPVDPFSKTLNILKQAKGVVFEYGEEHLMEVIFNHHSNGLKKDLRPDLPLIFYW